MTKKTFPLSHLPPAGAGASGAGDDRAQGQGECHDHVVATMMEFEPPLVGCVISGWNHSFDALRITKECVLNIPAVNLAKQVVGVGNCSGSKVDKFKKFKLTSLPASQVAPPLIAECYANLECWVADTRMVNKYNFFVLEVVKAWIDPAKKDPRTLHHLGKGTFMVAGRTIKLPSRMK